MKKTLFCYVMFLLCPLFLAAQVANNTSLVGTVMDATGSVIVGAHVTAINRDTKVSYNAQTDKEGFYSITGQVNPGLYDITVEQSGFKRTQKTGVVLTLNLAVRTDFKLAVGAETAEVTVSANTPAIQTDDSLLGETVSLQQVADLPMNGRNALTLATTSSNVTLTTQPGVPGSALNGVPPGDLAEAAGTRGVNNSITLDGISIMNNLGDTATVQPSPDALGAVQTQVGNYTAQYGNYLGVHINEATRSGTNSLHGTLFDYLQNDALNSRGFNTSPVIPEKNELRYNDFGGVISGPVIVPLLYNGHDKTFFMASYESLREHSVTNSYTQAWTPAELSGDFSQLLNTTTNGQNGKKVLLWSPIDGHPYFNLATGTQIINDQPAANSPIFNNFLSYASRPNVTAPGTLLTQNNLAAVPIITDENSSVDRVDENIGDNIRLFARFDWQRVDYIAAARDYVNDNYNPTWARNAAAGFTQIITPNLVNDLRGGFDWLLTDSLDYFYEHGPKNADSLLGVPAPFGVGESSNDPGLIDLSGGTSFSISETSQNWFQDDRTYQVYDQLSWTHGTHSFMVGIDVRKMEVGRAASNTERGILDFSSSYTSYPSISAIPASCTAATCLYGSGDASEFLGVMSGDTTPHPQVKGVVAQWRDGFFVQDDWQFSNKLTLQYGVRYELPQVPYSVNGFARILDPTYSVLLPATMATTEQTFVPNIGLKFTGPNHKDIAPRFGFAYRATNRVVIRGGGGIYYNPNQLNAYTLTDGNYPLASSVVYTSPLPHTQTAAAPYDTYSNPTPGAGTASPVAGIPGTYVSVNTVANPLPSETMYQWNLDNGIELWRNAGLELQYLGSRSIHLNTNYFPNQPVPGVGNQLLSVNARRPDQNWGQLRVVDNVATATYEGLTTVLRQRMSHGFSLIESYTWSHALDEAVDSNTGGSGAMWQANLKLDYGNSSLDVRHRSVTTFTYALPTLSHNFLLQELIGGWQVNGIMTFQSGTPFNVSFGSTDWANVGIPEQDQRPDWVHPGRMTCNKRTLLNAAYGTQLSCVDITAYAAPPRFTYGNLHRDDLHGPGAMYDDLSVFKDFKIHEQQILQLRAEGFNFLNHANVSTPGNVLSPLPYQATLNVTPESTVVGSPGYTVGTLSPAASVFGTVTPSAAGALAVGRIVQLSAKVIF